MIDFNKEDNKEVVCDDYRLMVNKIFKQPIDYCKNTHLIDKHIKSDLELLESESDESDSVYNKLVSLDTKVGREVLENFSGKYSTNTKYLKDTQKLMKHLKDMMVDKHMINNMTDFWMNIKTNKKFVETYQYLEFERFSYLNYSTVFLTWLTILNLFSPLLQVITPILLLLLPFLLMRSISSHSGVTISNYIEGL